MLISGNPASGGIKDRGVSWFKGRFGMKCGTVQPLLGELHPREMLRRVARGYKVGGKGRTEKREIPTTEKGSRQKKNSLNG